MIRLRQFAVLLVGAVLVVGCSTPKVPQKRIPPPPPERQAPAPEQGDPGATERFLDDEIRRRREAEGRGPAAQRVPPRYLDADVLRMREQSYAARDRAATDPAASDRWLADELDRRTQVASVAPPERIVERIYVERPVPTAHYGYAPRRGPGFPINTAVGAGIGAIIGNQSGDAAEGAWIGAGFGLLYDLMR